MNNFLIRYHISYIKASKRFLIALQWWVLIYLLVALLYIGLLRSIMSVYKWQNMLMMKCSCDLLQFLKRSVLNVKKKTLQKIARKLFSITVRLYKRLLLYCAASKNNVLCSLLCHIQYIATFDFAVTRLFALYYSSCVIFSLLWWISVST